MARSRHYNCLVITADGIPIARISPERAIMHMMENKAYMVQQQGTEFYHSQFERWPVPAIIRLIKWHRIPAHYYGRARLNTIHLFRRDNWQCQYCGRYKQDLDTTKGEYLTRDHVYPQARGGEDIWENVVLACNTCNNRKSDRTPEDAGLTLLKEPWAPTLWELNQNYVAKLMEANHSSEELRQYVEEMDAEFNPS